MDLAYQKAKKGKSKKPDIIEFAKDYDTNIEKLCSELLSGKYIPLPLTTFPVEDPKTRIIRKAHFRDRVVHHALCNLTSEIFDKLFIHDSFANQKGKGTSKAQLRFDEFKRRASRSFKVPCYVLKADIKKYFEEVDHGVLLSILRSKIKDERFISVVQKVLNNHSRHVGMPLGNQTSQTFANIYLNELDQYVKHVLKVKFYIRYVDDFVILHEDKDVLEAYKAQIESFLAQRLKLRLHPNKCKIIKLERGVTFLGFRIFRYHRLPRKGNLWSMKTKVMDPCYDAVCTFLEGWIAYAKHGNTFGVRKRVAQFLDYKFKGQISLLQIDRTMKHAQHQS